MDTGLETVVAAHTVLSDVDGAAGRLVIRGHDLRDWAGLARFEDALTTLWAGIVPDMPVHQEVAGLLGQARVRMAAALDGLPLKGAVIDVLRRALALVEDGDDVACGLDLVAMSAVASAAALRARRGLPMVCPDPSLSHSRDLLRMMRGTDPEAAEVAGLDTYLVTVCDHGLNASTFAARVVASTRAGLASAAIAGLSALKGPLHGGAPGPVLDMFDAIGMPERAEAWIEAAFARGERLMGFGHRVYRVRDPRADALKAAVARLPAGAGRIAFAEAVERVCLSRLAARHPERSLQTNVEFWTAVLLDALAIPRDAFTPVFACGRMLGWVAHSCEQVGTGRLVRPASVYVGPAPMPHAA